MYSLHLRTKVLKDYLELKSLRKVGEKYNLSKSIIAIWNKTKGLIRKRKPYRRKTTEKIEEQIVVEIDKQQFYTLYDLQILIKKVHKVILSRETIRKILRRKGYKCKRCHSKVKIKDEKKLIETFRKEIKLSKREIICLDETYFRYHMKPIKGWVKKTKECLNIVNKVYSKKVFNMLMVISEKEIRYELTKETMNSSKILNFVNKHKDYFKDKLLIMDNVCFHKQKEVQKRLKELNCEVKYIVPYHCELNPIEEVFSLLKHKVRKQLPETEKEYREAIENGAKTIPLHFIPKYYSHSFILK